MRIGQGRAVAEGTAELDPAHLGRVREEIDRLDASLIELIEARLRLAAEAADMKGTLGMGLRDVRREAEVTRRASFLARERGLDPEIVRDIFWRLIALSHRATGQGAAEASP